MNIRDISTKTIKNILLWIIFAPIIGFSTYYSVPQIYDLSNAIWTGTLSNSRLSAVPNSALANSSVTIGSTAISLGGTSTSLAGLVNTSATGIFSTTKEATGTTGLLTSSGFSVGGNADTEACYAFNAGTTTYNWAFCVNYTSNAITLARSGAAGGSNLTQNRWEIDSSGNQTIPGRINTKGIAFTASNPTISACGTSPSIDSNSSNYSGTVTVGSVAAASCTITFASAFGTYNHCNITSQGSVAALSYSYTLSAITVTATSLVSDKLDYTCDGY